MTDKLSLEQFEKDMHSHIVEFAAIVRQARDEWTVMEKLPPYYLGKVMADDCSIITWWHAFENYMCGHRSDDTMRDYRRGEVLPATGETVP